MIDPKTDNRYPADYDEIIDENGDPIIGPSVDEALDDRA